jgi:hypothetical protein
MIEPDKTAVAEFIFPVWDVLGQNVRVNVDPFHLDIF